MGLIGGSNTTDFSFDGIGDFNFEDLVDNASFDGKSNTKSKLEGINITELFSVNYEAESKDQIAAEFYDAKRFAKLNENEIPDREKVLAGLLLEKEGHNPVLMTRSGEAVQLEKKEIKIHQEATDGTEVVRTFESRDITIGSLSDEQYARIHSSAMTNLAFIARQQKDIDSEEKTGAKLKELASRRNISHEFEGKNKPAISSLFNGQVKYFTENRKEIDRKLDRFAFESRTTEKKRRREINKKRELRDKMRASKDEHQLERKEDAKSREIIVDSDR